MNGTTEYLDYGVQVGMMIYIIFTMGSALYFAWDVLTNFKKLSLIGLIISIILVFLTPYIFPYTSQGYY